MFVKFSAPRGNAPAGKLAEAVLQFTESEGSFLDGLELHGLTVWKRRDGSGIWLALPGREYMARGKNPGDPDTKKTFDFLRYTGSSEKDKAKLENLKALILEEYAAWAQSGVAR